MYKELIISAIVIILVIVVNFVMGKLVDDKLNRVIDLLAETKSKRKSRRNR